MNWVRARPGQATLFALTALWLLVGPLVAPHAPGSDGRLWLWPAGTIATVIGAATAVRLLRRGLTAALPEVGLCAAMTIWGVAGLLQGLGAAAASPALVSGAEIAELVALALVYAALRVLPATARLLSMSAGVSLDAAVLGVATAALATPLLSTGPPDLAAGVVMAVLLPAVLVLVCGAVMALLRYPSREVSLLLVGMAVFGCAATWLLAFRAASLPPTGLWPVKLLALAGVTLTCAGLVATSMMRARPSEPAPTLALRVAGDHLGPRAVITGVALAELLVTVSFLTFRDLTVPPLTLALSAATIVILAVREVVATRVRRQLVGRVVQGAHTDALTGLLNRVGMTDVLDAEPMVDGSLIVADIDQFSHANDLLGHSGADALLIRVARAMQAVTLPRGSVVARTGGDEFAVWLPGLLEPGAVAHRLMSAVAGATENAPGGMPALTASAGVAATGSVGSGSAPADTIARADLLLQRATAALGEAKSRGRASIGVFDAALADTHRRRQLIERRLTTILQEPSGEGLTIHLQPVVDLADGRVSGAEALARWHDPDLGWVTPGEFIPIAEETGLIVALGRRVLELAVDAIATLATTRPDLLIAVNVSAAQLRARSGGAGFTETVRQCLAQAAVNPDRLIVEVTESLLISEDDPAVAELQCLLDMGIRVAVDDFGTGYWSLAYLQWLPANILKIDRSLILQLGDAPRSEAVVRAIIDLATNLRMSVVVEGVETAEIARRAAELGAGLAQGWHFARAVPLAQLLDTVDRIEAGTSTQQTGERVPSARPPTTPRAMAGVGDHGRGAPAGGRTAGA